MEENKNLTQEPETVAAEETVATEETVAAEEMVELEEIAASEDAVEDKASDKRNKILLISAISAGVVVLALVVLLLVKGLPKIIGGDNPQNGESTESLISSEENTTSGVLGTNNSTSSGASVNNSQNANNSSSQNQNTNNGSSQNQNTNTNTNAGTSVPQNTQTPNANSTLAVTATKMVASNTCMVTGYCPKGTKSLVISGDRIEQTTVVPYAGEKKDYFMTLVKCTGTGDIKVVADGKETATRFVIYEDVKVNLMTRDEYRPVIGKNSFGHFYSALVGYSCSTSKLPSNFKSIAKNNIQNIVNAAKYANAKPIFLIIPSSAEIYPETLPDGYSKTTGESLYQAFYDIAKSCGAEVIYPKDTMLSHKNDGVGYQLYQHTDSHWSTYGAYWGTYDLFSYIASDGFSAAKPRTLSEMGFYTKEFYAGDNMFNLGLETSMGNPTFKTTATGMRELSTLYSLKTFENTLNGAYHSLMSPSLYLSEANSKATVTRNPNGAGLPNAVIMRDSFSKVSFDMVSDRFNTVYWQTFDNYTVPTSDLAAANANYLIYMYSERNLLKLMLNDKNATILNLK